MYDGLRPPVQLRLPHQRRAGYGIACACVTVPGAKDYAACDASLANVAPGSRIRFWHPDTESFPIVHAHPEPVRLDDGPADFAHDFAAVVDSSLGLVYRHGMKIAGLWRR